MCSLCYIKVMRGDAEKILNMQRTTCLSAVLPTLNTAMGMQDNEVMDMKKKRSQSSYRRCR